MCYIMETFFVGRADLKEAAAQTKISIQNQKHKDKQSKKRGNLSEWTKHNTYSVMLSAFRCRKKAGMSWFN